MQRRLVGHPILKYSDHGCQTTPKSNSVQNVQNNKMIQSHPCILNMCHWPSMFDSRDLQHGSPPQRRAPLRKRRVSRSAHRNPVVERKSLSPPLPSQSYHCLGNARLQPLRQEPAWNQHSGASTTSARWILKVNDGWGARTRLPSG